MAHKLKRTRVTERKKSRAAVWDNFYRFIEFQTRSERNHFSFPPPSPCEVVSFHIQLRIKQPKDNVARAFKHVTHSDTNPSVRFTHTTPGAEQDQKK